MATSPDAKTKELYKFVYVQIYAGELFVVCSTIVLHTTFDFLLAPFVIASMFIFF